MGTQSRNSIEIVLKKTIIQKKLPYGESPALGLDWGLWHSDGIRQELRRVLAVWYQLLNIIGDIGFVIVVES